MMRYLQMVLAVLPVGWSAMGQDLLPSIGIDALPGDATELCTPPNVPDLAGNFATFGPEVGEYASDFTLYDANDQPTQLAQLLQTGKPVLMIAGSYTCNVFRNHIPLINQLAADYGDLVHIVVVYTVEAHPTTISPYFGTINVGTQNTTEGILFPMPLTYGERKMMAETMQSTHPLDVPVLMDGPCNPWWLHYGPAPNNAYLIAVDGSVFAKHPWLDQYPHDIVCDLDQLLQGSDCEESTFGGSFTFQLTTSSTVQGAGGETLTVSALLTNPTEEDVQVKIQRTLNNVPQGWTGSLCASVCYPPETEQTIEVIEAGTAMAFHYYFYTTEAGGQGHVKVGFRNEDDFDNMFIADMYAFASATGSEEADTPEGNLSVYPNPASDRFTVALPAGDWPSTELLITALNGSVVYGEVISSVGRDVPVHAENLAPGLYFIEVRSGNRVLRSKLIKQ